MEDKELRVAAFTNNTASEYWRFLGQSRLFQENTEHRMSVQPYQFWGEWEKNKLNAANLVILEQLTNPAVVDIAHQYGAKVIFESDDAMIDSYGRERKNLMTLGPNFRGKAIETIKKCDAVTVTNQKLADNYRRFTDKPIYVLPNYVDFAWYGKKDFNIQRTTNEVRIGWQGSQGHFEDLRMLIPVLKKLIDKYPNVRLVYCGYGGMSSDKVSTEVGWGEDVFKEIPRERREFYVATKPDEWPSKHRVLDLDIGIAPLVDDYFNWCKTNIKWQEYGALRTPAVCSKVLYGDVVKHGKDGFIADTLEDWEKYLSMLIEDAQLRKKIGKDAQRRVFKDFDLEKHYTKWIDAYSEVVFGS